MGLSTFTPKRGDIPKNGTGKASGIHYLSSFPSIMIRPAEAEKV